MEAGAVSALSAAAVGMRIRHNRWLFRDLSVELAAGEIIRVLGAPGSGVSTLLQVFAGVRSPTHGTVRHRAPTIGFVPQDFPETLPMSAEEYLRHLGRIRGLRSDVLERRILALTRLFELGTAASQRVSGVHGNRTQLAGRVSIMQALLDEPSLLVLDNPWSSTDGHLREVLSQQILQLAGNGCLVLYSGFAPGLQPAKYLSLTGGRLRSSRHDPDYDGEPHVRFELTGRGPELAGQPGVISQAQHPRGGLVVTVERGHSDELLGRALQGGWSVRRVEPTE